MKHSTFEKIKLDFYQNELALNQNKNQFIFEINKLNLKVILKIIENFQFVNWTGVESKLSSEYFDVGFRDYTGIVIGI